MSTWFERTVNAFKHLPGVGHKLAQRIAFFLLELSTEDLSRFLNTIYQFKSNTGFCSVCGMMTEENPCRVCKNPSRDRSVICVVKEIRDAMQIEKSGSFKGLYHVLGGLISPVHNMYEKDLAVTALIDRLKPNVKEIVFAFEQTPEAEATIKHICRNPALKNKKVTRLAAGIPRGTGLEHIDEETISQALKHRSHF